MKKLFKLVPVLMAVIFVILSSIPFASAAELLDSTKKVSITLKCSKPGYTFTVYKVGTLNSTTTTPYETKYTSLVPAISASVLEGDSAAALAVLDKTTIPTTAPTVGSWTTTAASTTKTFSNLAQGIYYIKATSYPAGVKSVTNSIVALPYFNGEWVYTISAINLATKVLDDEAKTEKEITNSTKDNVNYTDVSLGDTVNFILKNTTAGSSDMKLTTYAVYDNMSAGLTLNNNSFNVYLADKDEKKIGNNLTTDDYKVNITQQEDGKNTLFNVSLTETYLKKEAFYASDVAYVMVTYTADLNKHAIVGTPGNPNEDVELKYGNDKSIDTVQGNTVYVYTYAIKTNKYDETGKNPLAGAEFSLFETEENAKNLKNAIATGKSDSNGLVKYYNTAGEEMRVQSGTYYVRETKAPAGYVLYGNIIEVPVTATYGDTITNGTYVTNCPTDGYVTFDLANHTVFIPKTGGNGTSYYFVLSAFALVSGLAFIFFYRKRKCEN